VDIFFFFFFHNEKKPRKKGDMFRIKSFHKQELFFWSYTPLSSHSGHQRKSTFHTQENCWLVVVVGWFPCQIVKSFQMVIHSNGICGGLCCRKFNMLPGFEDATSVANAILQAKAMMAQRSTAQAWPCLAGATGGAPQPMTMTAQSTMPMQMQSPGGEAGAYGY
jgi:hypothetical protein